MKTRVKNRFALSVLAVALGLVSADELTAQTFKALATNVTPVIVSGNTIYGFGYSGSGTIVALNTDGTGLRTLYAFTPLAPPSPCPCTNADGASPSGLTLSGSTLYGSCGSGGGSGNGTLFSLNTDGTGFTVLYTFAGRSSDGHAPSPLILSGGTLYGTTPGYAAFAGGAADGGTVFAVGTDGTGFTTLYRFSAPDPSTLINSDGAFPTSTPLILSGATLYGVTQTGGVWGRGTVFAVTTDGTGFATLHSFTAVARGPVGCSFTTGTNSDGATPQNAGLVLSSNTLYGTAYYGGGFGNGTVFALKTDGTGFTVLHNFSSYINCNWPLINADGGTPACTLVLSGNTLYGTTSYGGSSGYGVVFAVNTDGTGFTNLHSFNTASGGSLVVSGNNLYGGGNTLFSLALPIAQPQLSIVPAGANVVLSWPANVTGFTLQSTTDLASSFWTTNLSPPVVVNGQNMVTNPISGTRQYYRLAQ